MTKEESFASFAPLLFAGGTGGDSGMNLESVKNAPKPWV